MNCSFKSTHLPPGISSSWSFSLWYLPFSSLVSLVAESPKESNRWIKTSELDSQNNEIETLILLFPRWRSVRRSGIPYHKKRSVKLFLFIIKSGQTLLKESSSLQQDCKLSNGNLLYAVYILYWEDAQYQRVIFKISRELIELLKLQSLMFLDLFIFIRCLCIMKFNIILTTNFVKR